MPPTLPTPTYARRVCVKSSNELATKLTQDMEMMIEQGGDFTTNTLALPSRFRIAISGSGNTPLIRTSKQNAIRIVHGVNDARVEFLNFFTDMGKEGGAAVSCSGKDCVLRQIGETGPAMVLQFDGSLNLIAEGLEHRSGKMTDKGIYCGGPIVTKGARISKVRLLVPMGAEHGIRCHNYDDIQFTDVEIDYKSRTIDEKGNLGAATGAAVTFKDGRGASLTRGRINGPIGCGPLPIHRENRDKGWEHERCISPRFGFLTINTPQYVHFGAGCEDFEVADCVIRATDWDFSTLKGACVDIEGQMGAWPGARGVFKRCTFEGERLYSTASAPNIRGKVEFVNCTLRTPDDVVHKLEIDGRVA